MAGPREQPVRPPAVAGLFYPGDPQRCAALAASLTRAADEPAVSVAHARGAVVPHAGWRCSGAIAGEAIGTLAALATVTVELVVVFGAVHTPIEVPYAALDSHDKWELPGSFAEIAADFSRRLTGETSLFAVDDRLHDHEHAVEVELPLVRAAWPNAMVLPIEVPLTERAVEIGERTARSIEGTGLNAVFLASSDLTHYGPAYHLVTAGIGRDGLKWAKENDRRLLRIVTEGRAEQVVAEVQAHRNACGGGAIAAMLAACRVFGASRASVLRHASSYETLAAVAPQAPTDAVGYAAVVVGSPV